MNSSMTAYTQYSKIFNLIYFMRMNYMMNLQCFIFNFTYETFVRIKKKCSFSVITRTFSIIFIMYATSFESVKSFLFTFIRTKLRPLSTRNRRSATFLTIVEMFRRGFFTRYFPTLTRTESSSFVFTTSNIGRTLKKCLFTLFALKLNFFIPRRFIAKAGAIFSSIFFKRLLACGTNFHLPIITLAMANVHYKTPQPSEV